VLAAILLAASPIDADQFGKRQVFSGIWFTNFENSRFIQCRGVDCDNWPNMEAATLECAQTTCDALDALARKRVHQREQVAPDGEFQIRFIGRRSLATHEPRFIGDGRYTVRLERVLAIKAREVQKPSRE
jgi:hypothetical protein